AAADSRHARRSEGSQPGVAHRGVGLGAAVAHESTVALDATIPDEPAVAREPSVIGAGVVLARSCVGAARVVVRARIGLVAIPLTAIAVAIDVQRGIVAIRKIALATCAGRAVAGGERDREQAAAADGEQSAHRRREATPPRDRALAARAGGRVERKEGPALRA